MLVLASASPRRAELLRSAGVEFEVRTAGVDEETRPREAPIQFARRIASAKHAACPPGDPQATILAADTVVWTRPDEPPLQKPVDRHEAETTLQHLISIGKHHVTTAFALGPAGRPPDVLDVTTDVWFRSLGADEVARHLDSGDWRDKAGGYGIQSGAAGFVLRIEGSYTNVVGLPLAEVLIELRRRGIR